MKVEVTALRNFPYSDNPDQPDEVKRAVAGEKLTVNLSTARAWKSTGKVSFTEPKEAAEKSAPSKAD